MLPFIVAIAFPAAAGPDFERDVAPLLVRRCLECHSGTEPAGKLILTTAAGLAKGGKAGPGADLLRQRVDAGEMPPAKAGKPQTLPKAEADTLRAWVAAGTPWPKGRTLDLYERTTDVRGGRDWWSLQPVRTPEWPPGAGNPIDRFIRAKLGGLRPAPPAAPRALLRRLAFDLTGLPPTADELDAFAADPSPAAYEKVVDRLLASPQYGERWARHWLDVARFAETCGYERDQTKPHAWKYRDWVVAAFNADKPFARFVREQLAGDELPDRTVETVTATGFLRLGTWNDEPNDPEEYTYDRLEDLVGTTTTAFLAVTVKCARCHDHKFDPVPQRDYYRVAAAFWAGPVGPGPRELLGGPTKEHLGYDLLGWTDKSADPPPLRLLKKGDPHRPGEPVAFGFPSFVLAERYGKGIPPPADGARTTGRRLALADWIADPRNPLAARVWVNRMWQHHYGAGLVRSPDNFGFTGEKPTHPELLDWLAAEFVRDGGRSKPLHRLMVLSETYKQASVHPKGAEYAATDAGNRLWWRAERRRLDAEQLRDALLAASGRLDLSVIGGPSFVPDISPEALEGWSRKGSEWVPSPPGDQRRRTLYAFVKRGLLPPTLTVFDAPDTTLPCGKRDVTTVAPQALALLNNPFVHQQSEALAARAAGDDPVRRAWRFALGRDPRPEERAAADRHLAEQTKRLGSAEKALASLCHVLLNTNEFVYLD